MGVGTILWGLFGGWAVRQNQPAPPAPPQRLTLHQRDPHHRHVGLCGTSKKGMGALGNALARLNPASPVAGGQQPFHESIDENANAKTHRVDIPGTNVQLTDHPSMGTANGAETVVQYQQRQNLDLFDLLLVPFRGRFDENGLKLVKHMRSKGVRVVCVRTFFNDDVEDACLAPAQVKANLTEEVNSIRL